MSKRLVLQAIRLLVSLNLLYAAIFLKFAGAPGSVALFNRMSDTVHGLVSQPIFRLGSAVFETVVAVLLLFPKTARLGAGLTIVWMTAVILSHIFVLGYGWFFFDALMVMLLAVIYLLLTRRHSHWGESSPLWTANTTVHSGSCGDLPSASVASLLAKRPAPTPDRHGQQSPAPALHSICSPPRTPEAGTARLTDHDQGLPSATFPIRPPASQRTSSSQR